MRLLITIDRYPEMPFTDALEMGVERAKAVEALKAAAEAKIAALAENYRERVAAVSPFKLFVYGLKGDIANNPSLASPKAITLLEEEAALRGMTRDNLFKLIKLKREALISAALLVDNMELKGGLALASIDNADKDIETKITALIEAAAAAAESEFQALKEAGVV